MTRFNPENFNELIRSRRSVFPKDYTGEKVDDAIIQQLLENANWAPTHKLTEPWRFVVFTGEGLKKLADFQSECYKQVAKAKGMQHSQLRQNRGHIAHGARTEIPEDLHESKFAFGECG